MNFCLSRDWPTQYICQYHDHNQAHAIERIQWNCHGPRKTLEAERTVCEYRRNNIPMLLYLLCEICAYSVRLLTQRSFCLSQVSYFSLSILCWSAGLGTLAYVFVHAYTYARAREHIFVHPGLLGKSTTTISLEMSMISTSPISLHCACGQGCL